MADDYSHTGISVGRLSHWGLNHQALIRKPNEPKVGDTQIWCFWYHLYVIFVRNLVLFLSWTYCGHRWQQTSEKVDKNRHLTVLLFEVSVYKKLYLPKIALLSPAVDKKITINSWEKWMIYSSSVEKFLMNISYYIETNQCMKIIHDLW